NELGFKDKKIILFCGRVSKYKGIELVLDASLPLLKNDCVLIYLGGVDYNVKGTKEALESINKKIAENNVYDSVFFLGYRDDVREIMSISNVLVHPTEIEGFGLVLAEACALGLPIISSNSEAIPEVLSSTSATIIDNFNKDEYEKRIRDKLQECDDKKSHYRDKEIIFNKYSLESRVDNFCEKYL
ncbi:TPA: glycosyltransferase family 4 protein, partial [Vibrio parahaemolyticus]